MSKRIKKLITGIALVGALYSSVLADFLNIKATYNTKKEHSMVVLEGKKQFSDRFSVYGFIDALATSEKPLDPEEFYAELRLNYKIWGGLGVAAEYNGGNDLEEPVEDLVRLGPTFELKNGDEYTIFKFFPFETSGNKGPQLSAYTSKPIADGLSASVLVDYNFRPDKIYTEIGLEYKINNWLTAWFQLRGGEKLSKLEKIDLHPYIGLVFNF